MLDNRQSPNQLCCVTDHFSEPPVVTEVEDKTRVDGCSVQSQSEKEEGLEDDCVANDNCTSYINMK